MCRNPSIPSSRLMKAPLFVTFTTGPEITLPTGYLSSIVSHGFSSSCLRPSDTLLLSKSQPRIFASTTSPMLTISLGLVILFVQESSEMWARPSIPGSISINTPKLAIFVTGLFTTSPIWYFWSNVDHGSGSIAFKERLIFCVSGSMLMSLSWTIWPFFTKSFGLVTWPQDISLICKSPSNPPRSMKAPKDVNDFTTPWTISPTWAASKNFCLFSLILFSRYSLLETTLLSFVPLWNLSMTK